MTISLTLPPETEASLRERAAQVGHPVEDYVLRLVQQAIRPGTPQALLAALAAAPPVPVAWVDELEALIAQGQRAASPDDPFAEGA